jgi:hypothetical protein
MKVVTASTPEQEQFIKELVTYMYTEVFPQFFSDEYISEIQKLNVLIPENEELYNGTLKEAFHLISSLQALIAVIESVKTDGVLDSYSEIYEKNTAILEDYGYKFPFSIHQFSNARDEMISCFSKPSSPYVM